MAHDCDECIQEIGAFQRKTACQIYFPMNLRCPSSGGGGFFFLLVSLFFNLIISLFVYLFIYFNFYHLFYYFFTLLPTGRPWPTPWPRPWPPHGLPQVLSLPAAGSVHLMESLLDTVDIIHLPSQAACIWDFLRVLVSKLISNLPALINTRAKTLHFLFWHQKY